MESVGDEEKISIVRACRLVGLDRSGYYYQPRKDDTEVEERLHYYAAKLPTRGFPEYTKRIAEKG